MWVSTLWMDSILRFKWILRSPKVAFSHILTAAQLMQPSMAPKRGTAQRGLHLAGNDKVHTKANKKETTCDSQALKLWRRGHTGPGRTHGSQSAGRPQPAGMSRVWAARLLTAEWCWGLTVLSDAHLQKALLCLNPLAYLISAVYEALQKDEENVKN